eukprot:evm.model.scf_754.3 EVM.evm.TU.scf_754.3   scf_754:38832-48922(-)
MALRSHQVCPTCGGASFSNVNSTLVCDTCGAMSQHIVDIQLEEGAHMYRIDEARKVKGQRTKNHIGKEKNSYRRGDRVPAVEARFVVLCYVKCLQALLKLQADALVKLGVHPDVKGVLRKTWLEMVHRSHVLHPKVIRYGCMTESTRLFSYNKKALEARKDALQLSDTSVADPGYRLWFFVFSRLLPMDTPTFLCYLACVYLGEAVTPVDVSCWAATGKLPYFELPDIAEGILAREGWSVPITLFKTSSAPPPHAIYEMCGKLSDALSLKLPQLNVGGLVVQYLDLMQLPKGLAVFVMEVYRLLRWRPHCFETTGAASAHMQPYVRIMCLIVMTLKLLYGLDGRMNAVPFAPTRPDSWVLWAERIMDKFWPPPYGRPTEGEVNKLTDAELEEFVDFQRHKVFRGSQALKDVRRYVDVMEKYAEADVRGASPTNSAEEPENQATHCGGASDGCRGVFVGQQASEAMDFEETREQGPQESADLYVRTCMFTHDRSHTMPVDYAAVLAVAATLVGWVPHKLHQVLNKSEKRMFKVEDLLASRPRKRRAKRKAPPAQMFSDEGIRKLLEETAWYRTAVESIVEGGVELEDVEKLGRDGLRKLLELRHKIQTEYTYIHSRVDRNVWRTEQALSTLKIVRSSMLDITLPQIGWLQRQALELKELCGRCDKFTVLADEGKQQAVAIEDRSYRDQLERYLSHVQDLHGTLQTLRDEHNPRMQRAVILLNDPTRRLTEGDLLGEVQSTLGCLPDVALSDLPQRLQDHYAEKKKPRNKPYIDI